MRSGDSRAGTWTKRFPAVRKGSPWFGPPGARPANPAQCARQIRATAASASGLVVRVQLVPVFLHRHAVPLRRPGPQVEKLATLGAERPVLVFRVPDDLLAASRTCDVAYLAHPGALRGCRRSARIPRQTRRRAAGDRCRTW